MYREKERGEHWTVYEVESEAERTSRPEFTRDRDSERGRKRERDIIREKV